MFKLLTFFVLLSSGCLAYAKTVTSVAIAPQGAVIVVGTTLQYSVTCTYTDSTTDNCAAAGGATWSTPTAAMSVSGSGLASWKPGYDPRNTSMFPSGMQSAQGIIFVHAGGMTDRGVLLAQPASDTFSMFMTPDLGFYKDLQTDALIPVKVVVGSTVAIGVGFTVNNTGAGNPFQLTCDWSSSNKAVATISRYGLATAVAPGNVTITCGQAGNGRYGHGNGTGDSFSFEVVSPTPTLQTWYVRPKGGTPFVNSKQTPKGQCDGKHDADYPGSGVNRPCAVGNLRDLWVDLVTRNHEQWIIGPGDTVIVRQKASGYNLGLDQQTAIYGGTAIVPVNCGNPDCFMPTIPSGTAEHHTKILGENSNSCHADSAKTQLNVSWGSKNGINVRDSQFVDVACFTITDQAACSYNGNFKNKCLANSNQGLTGITQSALTASVTYTDIFIDGLSFEGIHGATGVGVEGDYVHIRGVPMGGIDMDDAPHGFPNISVAGGFTLKNSITEFTGCVEEYPVVHNYPYIECRDSELGGYGDGFGTASTTGDWTFDHDIWRYNYQDGLDLLHSGLQSLSVTNSQSYGNDGQAYKIGSADKVIFRNNIALENCNRLAYVIGDEPASAIVPGVNYCRANGEWIALAFTPLGTYDIQNNTLIGYGNIALAYGCSDGGDNCSDAKTTLQNNIFLGYSNTLYNGGDRPVTFCALVNFDCGHNLSNYPANMGWAIRSHNLYYNFRSGCPSPVKKGEVCVDPRLHNATSLRISSEAALDDMDFNLTSRSPAIGAGVAIPGLTTDYEGDPRPSPPSIGAVERRSDGQSEHPGSHNQMIDAGWWVQLIAWTRDFVTRSLEEMKRFLKSIWMAVRNRTESVT
jgi:Bacterial Ig-like domain (group 2)